MVLFMYFILSHVCWSYVCLPQIYFLPSTISGFASLGATFLRLPFRRGPGIERWKTGGGEKPGYFSPSLCFRWCLAASCPSLQSLLYNPLSMVPTLSVSVAMVPDFTGGPSTSALVTLSSPFAPLAPGWIVASCWSLGSQLFKHLFKSPL